MSRNLLLALTIPAIAAACVGELGSVVGAYAAKTAPIGVDGWSDTPSGNTVAAVAASATPAVAAKPFVVHEWGTFTSVQGSNGGTLDGLHHEEEALPAFVYGRTNYFEKVKGVEGLPEPCNQKMETPVVYFYSDKPRQVKLHVTFANGIISQWFPAATAFAPKLGTLSAYNSANLDWGSGLSKGSIDWDVLVDPALDMAKAPWVSPDSVWQPSRQTAATPLRFVGMGNKDGKPVDETERFLFYRGVGRFVLPVQVRIDSAGAMKVINGTSDELPFAVILNTMVTGKGTVGGVVELGALQANATRKVALPQGQMPVQQAINLAKSSLKAGLVASGLYDDEARAMVDTWQKSWFASEGVRLLYILPRPWTDKLLPLRVDPPADQMVRTLVGRIEVLTPASEAEALAIVKSQIAKDVYTVPKALGRFFEPRIRRACQMLSGKFESGQCKNLAYWSQVGL